MSQIQGRFFDGRSAAEQWVGVTIEAAGLRLFGASGQTQADWPFAELKQVPGSAAPHLRLSLRSLPDARLVIDDASAIGRSRRNCPAARTIQPCACS